MDKLEVIILSGFLGSGKTTLLQNLIEEDKRAGREVAVLMNEIGEYSVDSNIIGNSTPIKEIVNGCICCSSKDELEISLLTLYQNYNPDVIYIEASGVAHPIEILEACLSPLIAEKIEIRSIITTVDAQRWAVRGRYSTQIKQLFEEQVIHADDIIINKTDLLPEEELKKVLDEIKQLNKRAILHCTQFSKVPLTAISKSFRTSAEAHEELNVKKHLHIQSMTYVFTNQISNEEFEKWLRSLPDSVLRIKGFIRFIENNGRTSLFQYSYGVPQYNIQDIAFRNTIVVIGENLNKELITKQLQALEQVQLDNTYY